MPTTLTQNRLTIIYSRSLTGKLDCKKCMLDCLQFFPTLNIYLFAGQVDGQVITVLPVLIPKERPRMRNNSPPRRIGGRGGFGDRARSPPRMGFGAGRRGIGGRSPPRRGGRSPPRRRRSRSPVRRSRSPAGRRSPARRSPARRSRSPQRRRSPQKSRSPAPRKSPARRRRYSTSSGSSSSR